MVEEESSFWQNGMSDHKFYFKKAEGYDWSVSIGFLGAGLGAMPTLW